MCLSARKPLDFWAFLHFAGLRREPILARKLVAILAVQVKTETPFSNR